MYLGCADLRRLDETLIAVHHSGTCLIRHLYNPELSRSDIISIHKCLQQLYDILSNIRLYQCVILCPFHEPIVAQVAQNSGGSNTFGRVE